MQYLVKIFIFSTLFLMAMHSHSQVTGIQYSILFNAETQLFDCYIYIDEGQTSNTRDRVQFNSQYSLMIPTGYNLKIESNHMPLLNNRNFEGDVPIEWTVSSKLTSPEVSPDFDFYGITPTLAPVGFYNKLQKGDFVKLFSLRIEGENFDPILVRIFDNQLDPKSFEFGMLNGDFSNGFTIGGYEQLYKGIKLMNQVEANYIPLDEKNK